MRDVERVVMELGLTETQMMENAGANLAWLASTMLGAGGLGVTELFIDAILGFGQRGDPSGDAAALVAATANSPVLSLDVPTGLELERGIVGDPAVRAAATLTEALPKEALRAGAARPLVGDLYLADISIPAIVYDRLGITYQSPFSGSPIVQLV